MNNESPWVLKYAPLSVSDMVLDKNIKSTFNDIINNKSLNNICLEGNPGIGKTTLAKILVNSLNCEYKFQSCSADGSIDMIKTTIQDYCQLFTEQGKIKIIILDEADQLSQQAQMALRNIIVDSMKDTRFILTCNYIDKIIPAIQSRCTPIKLQFSIEDVAKYIINILKSENIKFTKTTISDFFNNILKKQFPDIRSIIEKLQMCCTSGELIVNSSLGNIVEDEAINTILNNSDPKIIREWLLNNEDKFSGDYIKLAGNLFNNIQDPKQLLIIADYIYKMTIVFDKEIQFYAMLISLKEK